MEVLVAKFQLMRENSTLLTRVNIAGLLSTPHGIVLDFSMRFVPLPHGLVNGLIHYIRFRDLRVFLR